MEEIEGKSWGIGPSRGHAAVQLQGGDLNH